MKHNFTSVTVRLAQIVSLASLLSLVSIPKTDASVVKATASTGYILTINDSWLNSQPNHLFLITANWNPYGAGSGIYNNHATGVYYNGSAWTIYNEDYVSMLSGAAFCVRTLNATADSFIQTATATNILRDTTYIDNPQTNGQPNARIQVTHNFNPGGAGRGFYNNHPTGVWYDGSRAKWAIFNQDGAAMVAGVAFTVNVLPLSPPDNNNYTHVATAANILGNVTYLNHPLLNGYSKQDVIVTAVYNPNGQGGVRNNHHLGVFYSTSLRQWGVFNQDGAAMPAGAAFHIWTTPPPP